MYRTQYEIFHQLIPSVHEHNAPCAVCYTLSKETWLMIHTQITCPISWTLEFSGYLINEQLLWSPKSTNYVCVDKDTEVLPGTSASTTSIAFLYHVQATCHDIPCGLYISNKAITCAVCMKKLLITISNAGTKSVSLANYYTQCLCSWYKRTARQWAQIQYKM